MIDHIEECPTTLVWGSSTGGCPVCVALRAHGDRVRAETLAEARDAVAAYLREGTCPDCSYSSRDDEILAVIDALRGES